MRKRFINLLFNIYLETDEVKDGGHNGLLFNS